ncbi:MAG: glycosyltransferase [Myxococcaceae bacterium]
MRVLHVYSGNLFGGVETMLLSLVRHRDLCPQMQTEVALCFEGRLAHELRSMGAAVHPLGEVRISRPWTVFRARHRLRQVLRAGRFDAVICHSAWSQALFGPIARGVPQVFFAHDASSGRHWLDRLAQRTKPDLVLSNSHFTQSRTATYFPSSATQVWYLPVSPSSASTGREAVRAELKTPGDAVVIVQTSRMQAWKGHELHLEALAKLRSVPRWICWMVGGAQREEEEAYVRALRIRALQLGIEDRIRFVGQRSDVPRLLAAADIHCQPNLSPEPFGIAFIEALYSGLPVVSTRMGAAPELLDPSCSVLVPAQADALSGALRQLIEDAETRRRLGAASPARAKALCEPQPRLHELRATLSSLKTELRS